MPNIARTPGFGVSIQRKELVPDRTCIVQVCLVLPAHVFDAQESDSEDRQVERAQDNRRRRGSGNATRHRRDTQADPFPP